MCPERLSIEASRLSQYVRLEFPKGRLAYHMEKASLKHTRELITLLEALGLWTFQFCEPMNSPLGLSSLGWAEKRQVEIQCLW